MIKALVTIQRYTDVNEPMGGWIHIPTELPELLRNRVYQKLAYWGLLEQRPAESHAKAHNGSWRVTKKGLAFLTGRITVPQIAYSYNKEVLGYNKPMVAIGDEYE